MKKLGIRKIVLMLTLLPLVVIVASMEFFFLHARFSDIDNSLIQRGKLITNQLASTSEYGVFSNNLVFLQNIAQSALQQEAIRSIVIQDTNLKTLVSAGEVFELDSAGVGNVNPWNPLVLTDKHLRIYQPIVPTHIALDELDTQTSVPNIGGVIVEISRTGAEQAKSQMLWFTILITMLILMFPLYVIYRASRGITGPIRKLSDAVLQIAKGNMNTRVHIKTQIGEISELSIGINEMASLLQQEHEVMQRRVEDATQALRLKKEEAERASHDKSHFLAVASHDLRQPLHALGLYVNELQRSIYDTQQQHLVEQIEQSIETLSTLLNALLDISKLDAGIVIPHLQNCDVNVLLSRVSSDYQMLAGIKNIRLVIHPCSAFVHSDPVLLERILMNLVSNAIRYTKENGCVLLACRRRGQYLRFEVRDNGIGINRVDHKNIFREFYRVNQSFNDFNKGLGLGLAIVDRLVRLLGHHLDLRSAPGLGSVFAFELPLSAISSSIITSDTSFGKETDILANSLSGKRVLVVDDDVMVLTSTAGVLASWGCVVDSVLTLNEVECLLLEGIAWDLIISDYQLGIDASGIDVIELARRYLNSSIQCILISGDTSPPIMKLAGISGLHLLHKPVKPAKLKSLLIQLSQVDTTQK